ncbi:hypothetical protein [Paenibacillus sp. O199]|uniref:hypothetical protein n=1 Tax=Paenibacillus sp. O199 TaxID=1643925 RepID=UPI0007BFB599|nr:hypothetical protein [Paenibacillus sp. O199]
MKLELTNGSVIESVETTDGKLSSKENTRGKGMGYWVMDWDMSKSGFEHNENTCKNDVLNTLLEMAEQNQKSAVATNSEKWHIEPDCVELKTSDDYHLVIWRNPISGGLNGYVGINRSHPFFAHQYVKKQVRDLEVHGGATFSGKRSFTGFKKKYWYLGFDTGHCFDFSPFIYEKLKTIGFNSAEDTKQFSSYKDISYVINETVYLYDLLKEAKAKDTGYVHSFKKEYKLLTQAKRANKRLSMSFI